MVDVLGLRVGGILIILLPKTEQDEPFLQQLYYEIRAAEISAWPMPEGEKQFFLQMQYHFQRQQYDRPISYRNYDVIWHNEQRVGRFIVDRQEHNWRIVDISILPAMQNQGIGSKLITQLQTEARQQAKQLALSVLLTNPAGRLYERLGFVEHSRDEVYRSMIYVPS